jgi:large subunit ribosomal protein L17
MRHSYFGKKLSRTKNERRRLLQIIARDLLTYGKIKTTLAKAKAVQPLVEKLITNAKKGSNSGINRVRQVLADKKSVDILIKDATTRFATRNSGYTRIIKLGTLRSDAAPEVLISFVDEKVETVINKDNQPLIKKTDIKTKAKEKITPKKTKTTKVNKLKSENK